MPRIITQCVLVIAFAGILSISEEINTESVSLETTAFSKSTEFFTDGEHNYSSLDRSSFLSPNDVQILRNISNDDSSSNSSLHLISHDLSLNTTPADISEVDDAEPEESPDKFKQTDNETSNKKHEESYKPATNSSINFSTKLPNVINTFAVSTDSITVASTIAKMNDSENYESSEVDSQQKFIPETMEVEKELTDQKAVLLDLETTQEKKESSTLKMESNSDKTPSTNSIVYSIESNQQSSTTYETDVGMDGRKDEHSVAENNQSSDKKKDSELAENSPFGDHSVSSEMRTTATVEETTVTPNLDVEMKENLEIKRSTRKRSLNTTVNSKLDEITSTTAFSASTVPEFQTSISTSISQYSEQNKSSPLQVAASIKKEIQNMQVESVHSEAQEVTVLSRTESTTDNESTTNSILTNTQNNKEENVGAFDFVKHNASEALIRHLDVNIDQSPGTSKLQSNSVLENIDLTPTKSVSINDNNAMSSESSFNIHSENNPSSHPTLGSFTEHPLLGDVFDPNGVTHQDSPDPDSVTFSVNNSEFDERERNRPVDMFNAAAELETNHKLTKYESDLIKRLQEDLMYGDGPVLNESSEVGKLKEFVKDKVHIFSPQLLPHDDPDVEVVISKDNFRIQNHSEIHTLEELTTTASSTHFKKSEDSGVFHIGAPKFDFEEKFSENRVTLPTKYSSTQTSANKNLDISVSNDIAEVHHPTNFKPHSSTVPSNVEAFSLSFEPQTEQSEVRPVMLKIPSPPSSPVSASSQGLEPSTAQSHWESSQATMSFEVETTTPGISSPILTPDPAPSTADEKLEKNTELPTTVIQPELVESFTPKNSSAGSVVHSSNSTIAGIAVKTSVSVSIPVLDNSSHNALLQADDAPHNKTQVASMHEIAFEQEKPNISAVDVSTTTQSPTESSASTTESGGVRIRKPKIKIPGIGDAPSRAQRPFTPRPPPRASTPEGPPVSIFSKSRSRRPSITSSTTASPLPRLATVRIGYPNRAPGFVPLEGEFVFSMEPVTTTVPTTTETEEPFSDEPFTDPTQTPSVSVEDDVTLVKVAGYIVLEKGLRWSEQLDNRHSPAYKERANFVHLQLERLFRSSPIAPRLWKIRIDGFSGLKDSRAVAVDFFVYLIKTKEDIKPEHLAEMFHDKLKNNTFSRFRVDTSRTAFELLQEEHLNKPTPIPEESPEPPIPQWAIAVIVIGAASLIFIILFAAVTVYGRHHMRRRYSSKLSEEDIDRSGDWESKMASAYENLAADTIYDAEDLQRGDSYKKHRQVATFHGRPMRPKRCDSWSSSDWSTAPRRQRPHVHRIVY